MKRRQGKTLTAQTRRVRAAFSELLQALNDSADAVAFGKPAKLLRQTPQRATALWLDQLLAGEHADIPAILQGAMPHRSATPVCVTRIGVHLVCPHHLTIAFGHAHVAYVPQGQVAGLGAISDLVQACTARFVLQEDAVQLICDALVKHLDAKAAVALIDAVHPCHSITRARSHDAHVVTLARAGKPAESRSLERLILAGTSASA